ncbi:MAG: PKD domain-containing protein, partial [Gaiellaceae bacterium]
MRRALVLAIFLAWAPAAQAAPNVSIAPSALIGQAPFAVTLTAVGTADSYSWDLGDGHRAEGAVVHHAYATGRYKSTLTAPLGGEMTRVSVTLIAAKLVLSAPRGGTYGRSLTMRGRIVPALAGAKIALRAGERGVAQTKTDRTGRFRFRPRLGHPASYQAGFGSILSNVVTPAVRPQLAISLPRSRIVGRRLIFGVRLRPAAAGSLRVRVWRGGRELSPRALGTHGTLRLGTHRPTNYVIQVAVAPAGEFARVVKTVQTAVHVPYLGPGSRGPSVRFLERRLTELRFALRGVDGLY